MRKKNGMATISNNDIIINYKLGDTSGLNSLISKFDKLSNEEEDVIAKAKELVDELRKMGATGKGAGDGVNDGLKKAKGGAGELISSLKSVGAVMGVAFSTAAIVNFGKAALEVTGKFQTMAAVLKNTLGSESAAQAALVRIQELAAKTPFSVEQLTASFVKLANQGFQPTNAQIIRLGDLAASTGKDFNMLAEAIIDAQVGEFERLKEFGIRAKKEGDQVTFTFKGVETTVRNTSTAIRDYIVSLGDVAGVTGAMKAQSETLEGAVSNLGDAWDMFLNSIGNNLAPIYKKAIQVTAAFLSQLKDLFQTEEGKIGELRGDTYNKYTERLAKASDAALQKVRDNSSKELEAEKIKNEKLAAAFKQKQKDYNDAIALSGAQGARLQTSVDQTIEAQQLKSSNKKIAMLEAINTAASDLAKQRLADEKKREEELDALAKAKEAKDAAAIKKLQEEFANRKRLLELEKQYQTLLLEAGGNPNARLAAEKQYYDGLVRLQQEYANKGIKITQLEIDTTKLQRDKAAQDLTDAEAKQQLQTLDGIKAFNDKRNAEMEKAAKAEEERRTRQMNATKEQNEKELQDFKDKEAKKAEIRRQAEEMAFQVAANTINSIFNLSQAYRDVEMQRKQRQFDEEIRLADGNVQKITEIEEKRRAAEKEFNIRRFKAEQQQAIANIVFATGPEVIKNLKNPPLLALLLFSAAAQTAAVLAQPVPEFAKGVENFEGGPAIVGEQGRELVRTDKGLFLTPDKATMTYLPKGSDVITAPKTRELLQGNSTFLNRQNQWTAIDTAPIAQAIKAIPVQSLEISERGLERYVTKGNRTTKILNKKRGANL